MRIILFFAILGYAASALAFNPGFDCEQADDSVSQLVCSDYHLSRADRLLSVVNGNVMERNEPNTAYFTESQKRWFGGLAKTCGLGTAAKACLLDAYKARMDELRSIAGCNKVTVQAGSEETLNENSYAMVPQGTHIVALGSHNKIRLGGDFNTINIRHGKILVAIPAGAQQPFNNMVDSCTLKKR